jgi:hypothetical protein
MPTREYFADVAKKHGFTGKGDGGNADYLLADFNKQTQGLDREVAKEALDGGRLFGESDRKRYDELMKARSQAKEKAQNFTNSSEQNVQQTQNANTKVDQSQRVEQDNDVNASINGDNNVQNIEQDNSVRNYGGNSKVFNYQGGSNPYMDTPVSAGTMGGFFHDDDSPSSSAAFVDRYSTQNRDNQKRYKNPGIAQTSINNAKRNEAINFDSLDNRIQDRSKATRARSTSMASEIFGDMYSFNPAEFRAPKSPNPIEKPSFM